MNKNKKTISSDYVELRQSIQYLTTFSENGALKLIEKSSFREVFWKMRFSIYVSASFRLLSLLDKGKYPNDITLYTYLDNDKDLCSKLDTIIENHSTTYQIETERRNKFLAHTTRVDVREQSLFKFLELSHAVLEFVEENILHSEDIIHESDEFSNQCDLLFNSLFGNMES